MKEFRERRRGLYELAELNGVQASYFDTNGMKRAADPEVVKAVLGAMDVPAEGEEEICESLRETRLRKYRRGVEAVMVIWRGRGNEHSTPKGRALRLSASLPAKIYLPAKISGKKAKAQIVTEDGQGEELAVRRTGDTVDVEGERFEVCECALPELRFGYQTLEVCFGETRRRALVMSAPMRSFREPRAGKMWGGFLPMHAAHSKESWGAGNFSDFARLSAQVAGGGGDFLGTLPLLGAFLDFPVCEPSPYSPASRLFWNEFFIDVPRVPEFQRCAEAQKLFQSAGFQRQVRAFRRSELIDYMAQWGARRAILEKMAKFFFSESGTRRGQFERFRRERPDAEHYAAFRAVCDRLKTGWRGWPERLRGGKLGPGDYDEATKRFYHYSQWLAQEQVATLARIGEENGARLYLDLPVGVNPDGYDVWRERGTFALGANAGAPPDMFFSEGQDWGFSPLHPRHLRESGYRYLREVLAFHMRHAGLLRIDHVMGLHRLYWVPRGLPATKGAYVRYPAEEWYAVFNIESHRHRTLLAGENLGTVPPEVNRGMARHGMRGMYVLEYELQPDPKAALRQPEKRTVACLNTHDMPTFAAFWRGRDLSDRAGLGLMPNSRMPSERLHRRELRTALAEFLKKRRFLNKRTPGIKEVLRALLQWLRASGAEIILVNLEDLWFETASQNIPGTTTQHPNWRRKAKMSIEEISRTLPGADWMR